MNEHQDGRVDAVLQQVPLLGERLGGLDERERTHAAEAREALGQLRVMLHAVEGTAKDQAEFLGTLDERLTAIAGQLAGDDGDEDGEGYRPRPVVRWWSISDDERDAALTRLRGWVAQIYLPHYGHIAASLRPCWPEHLFCLVTLDWLSELWSVLHLQPSRSARDLGVAAQFHVQIMPEAAAQLAKETSGCGHRVAPALDGRTGGGRHG